MPYIPKDEREELDLAIEPIFAHRLSAGQLNYVISRIVREAVRGGGYARLNDAIGALECAKLELYRRVVAPYEDRKIAENGDLEEVTC